MWRRRRHRRVIQSLRRQLAGLDVRHTTPERRADLLCADAIQSGADGIIVAGGDGTIHEAVNGLAGSSVPLALLPMGTANVLAREIGLPSDPLRACDVLHHGAIRTVYLGQVGTHYFTLMASAGVDAETVYRVDIGWQRIKPWAGMAIYLAVGLKTIAAYRYPSITITIGDRRYFANTVIVAKAQRYGGDITIAPQASLSAPLFNVCLFRHRGMWGALRDIGRVLRGRHVTAPNVTWLQTTELTLQADEGLPIQADGEFVGRLPATITIAPRTLQLWCPAPRT